MKLLFAMAFPTIYLLSQKKWGLAVLTAILCFVSIVCILSIVLFWGAPICWLIAAVPAMMVCREKRADDRSNRHAKQVGREVHAAMTH